MTEHVNASTTVSAKIQHHMTLAFVFFLSLGIFFTFIHPWLPVWAVIGYFLFGVFTAKKQRNSERFADSLYYLGFLLTLFALLYATIGDKVSEQIIQSLGTGLSTTLAGLGLRVIIIQLRETVSDQEEEAQVSLEVETNKLIATLSQFTSTISYFQNDVAEQARLIKITLENGNRELNHTFSELATLPRTVDKLVISAVEGLATQLSLIDIPKNLFVSKVDAALAPAAASFANAANRVDQGWQAIENAMERVGSGIEEEGTKVAMSFQAKRAQLEETFDGVARLPAKVNSAIDLVISQISEKLTAIDFNVITSRQENVLQTFEAVGQSLAGAAIISADLAKAIAAIGASAERMDAAVSSASKSSDVFATAAARVSAIAPATVQMAEALTLLEGIVKKARDATDAATRELSGVSGDIKSLRHDIGGVREATRALIDFATQDLKK